MRSLLRSLVAAAILIAPLTATHAASVTPAETEKIAKEAYIYGFPLVDNYRILYAYFIDKGGPEYRAPIDQLSNLARVYTPADRAVQTPNSDTPYSSALLDLRAGPMVLTLPPIGKDRYYSVQLIDLYTHNFAYLGTRTTGNDGGTFMIAGPDWQGETPKGITKFVPAETEFVFALIRTQLFNPADLDNVKKIQGGYKLESLLSFLHQDEGAPAPAIDWPKPLSPADERTSPEFFNLLAFVLQFCPVNPEDAKLRKSFAAIGIEPGKSIDIAGLPPKTLDALKGGMASGQKAIDALRASGKLTSADYFGTREHLAGNYLRRALGAQAGIYGNSVAEAAYPSYSTDALGKPLDASKANYTMHFAPGHFPPVDAFWSLTMYDLPDQLLIANPIDRYLINSPMLPDLKLDPDGGLTIYVQANDPGADKRANWLPAPNGPFFAVMRLYLPKPAFLKGEWKAPPLSPEKKS